jgi:sugar O-acyltransferase (sialic acid O-acetyltransferase NeuD family)
MTIGDEQHLILIGAGGHARVVLDVIRQSGREVLGLYDDMPQKLGTLLSGVPVVGPVDELRKAERFFGIVAVGDNEARRRLVERLPNGSWVNAIHPRSIISEAVVGQGSVIMAGAVVQPGAVVGKHSIINTAASLDHDCVVGDYVHVGVGVHLCGRVVVEDSVLLGVGAVVVPGVRIGRRSIVGAGAVVVRDVADHGLLYGVPARLVRKLPKE